MTDRQIENRIRKLAAIEAQAKALTAQADAIKAEIKAEIETRPGCESRFEYRAHGVKVSYTQYEQMVFDSRAFCSDASRKAQYEAFKKPVKKRPFTYGLYEEVRA